MLNPALILVALSCPTDRFWITQHAGGGSASNPDRMMAGEVQVSETASQLSATRRLVQDPAGALIREEDLYGAVLASYGYDWGYRLSSWARGNVSASYVTDAVGRRLKKAVTTTTAGGIPLVTAPWWEGLMREAEAAAAPPRPSSTTVTELFAHDGEDILAEYGGAFALQARYLNGLGVDRKLAAIRDWHPFRSQGRLRA